MIARGRTGFAMALVMVVGVVAFGWPFLARPGSQLGELGHGSDASLVFVVLMGLLALVLLAELSSGGMDAKSVAVLGVLAAAGGALRVLSAGTAGLEPMFFLLVIAGRVLGPVKGFMLGALALLTSAFLTAGVGPWTPFQMLSCGWVAMGAALLPRVSARGERWLLAAYGLLAGFAFGAVMDLWDWAFFQGAPDLGYVAGLGAGATIARFGQFYLVTSAGYDAFRAVGNAAMIVALGPPVLASLARLRARASFQFVGRAAAG